jgi:hypothetical protein
MAKKQKTKLAALVREWERAKPYTLQALVIRTAAYLTRVRDVPRGVIASLDALGSDDGKYLATYVDEVLRFLRELETLERIQIRSGGNSIPSIHYCA